MNARGKIDAPFGASLTRVAVLPAGAQRDLADPFAEKKRPWGLYCVLAAHLLLALGWSLGTFDRMLSGISLRITRSWILHHQDPPR
ncbi:MAG TPA: hypothetical protein VMD08_17310 [Candidatus Baltobacteraceae bacterium]|nr:hypothetical protein [Candidatus Baltobacteraceae bacterium]